MDSKAVTPYFALLSALESTGVEIDIKYFDYVRGIIQLNQYVKYASKEERMENCK